MDIEKLESGDKILFNVDLRIGDASLEVVCSGEINTIFDRYNLEVWSSSRRMEISSTDVIMKVVDNG